MLKKNCIILIFFNFFVSGVLSFDQVWLTFNATDVDNETVIQYEIRDIPPSQYKKAKNLMEQYLKDESVSAAMGINVIFFQLFIN